MTLTLSRNPHVAGPRGPLAIIVLDGVGVGRRDEGDAVFLARTPTLDMLDRVALRTELRAHGTHVGMPSDDDMGNSEVGHNALGCGRIFDQGALLVEQAIASGAIFEGEAWRACVARALDGGALHLLGLLSDGNVHSHIDHVFAMLRQADQVGVRTLRVHVLLDGRDVGATSALDYVLPLEELLADISGKPERDYQIASGGGRMFVTMDRYEADWSIVERGWNTHVRGHARAFTSASEAIRTFRAEASEISDQVLPPFVVARDGAAVGPVRDGDALILFNFRGDRAIEITRAFEDDTFAAFERGPKPDVVYAGMMQYDGDLRLPSRFLVTPPAIDRTMGEYLAHTGLRQLAISETQKFGHVTYFWNGNRSGRFDDALETYIEVPSDRVDFSQRPWMKAAEVTDATLAAMRDAPYDLVRLNYANGDMVGHTGALEATIIAVEAVDLSLGRLLTSILAQGGAAIITADHGNADQMFQIDKKTRGYQPDGRGGFVGLTSHTLNAVPCWILAPHLEGRLRLRELASRRLSNVAATAFVLLGLEPPELYDPSLVEVVEG